MRNNNYLSLINFKVKLHRQRLFFIKENDFGGSIFLNVVNMVSRGLLESHVGWNYGHNTQHGVLTPHVT